MKVIYMGTYLGYLHSKDPESAQKILEKGEVKELESGFKYVVVNYEK